MKLNIAETLQETRDFRDITLEPTRLTQQVAMMHTDVRLDHNAVYYGGLMRAWIWQVLWRSSGSLM